MLKQLFEDGISFNEFVETGDDKQQAKIKELLENIEVEADTIKKVESIDKGINILAVSEIWCGDCVINVPAIEYLSELNEKVNIKILPKEDAKEILDKYKVEGTVRIPTFIVCDDEFNEVGALIEKPQIVLDAENSGDQVQRIVAKKKYRNGEYMQDIIEDIMHIVEK